LWNFWKLRGYKWNKKGSKWIKETYLGFMWALMKWMKWKWNHMKIESKCIIYESYIINERNNEKQKRKKKRKKITDLEVCWWLKEAIGRRDSWRSCWKLWKKLLEPTMTQNGATLMKPNFYELLSCSLLG